MSCTGHEKCMLAPYVHHSSQSRASPLRKLRIERRVVIFPRISPCRVCNRHVIRSVVSGENYPIDVNRGRIPSVAHFHDL